jgi:hypothetical protein
LDALKGKIFVHKSEENKLPKEEIFKQEFYMQKINIILNGILARL